MKDFYRVLKVQPTATLKEIKASYRALVLELHPDRLQNDTSISNSDRQVKTAQFKVVTEAYAVLSDQSQRRDYDLSHGNSRYSGSTTGTNGYRPRHKDYRKVYRPYTPPDFKLWDHKRHYDMHYGDGMQREAIKQATEKAKLDGAFEYESPLGKGFTFDKDYKSHSNPYSKYRQGPPEVVFEYEEGYQGDTGGGGASTTTSKTHAANDTNNTGKQTIYRRERIVQDMYGRRAERQARTAAVVEQQTRLRRQNAAFATDPNECVIL